MSDLADSNDIQRPTVRRGALTNRYVTSGQAVTAREVLDGIRALRLEAVKEALKNYDDQVIRGIEPSTARVAETILDAADSASPAEIVRLTAAVEGVLALADQWQAHFPYRSSQVRTAVANALTEESQ